MKARGFFVWLHRWVGLLMAGFLIIVGLTGSLLAFNMELERVFAPQLFAGPRPGAQALGLGALAESAEGLVPQGRVIYLTRSAEDQIKVYFEPREDPVTKKAHDLGFTEFFLDPYTGAELGRRRNADLSQGLVNLMPFIYDLHWRLALGDIGQWVLGVVALAWTIDCFVAFYLTLPQTTVSFWRRWKLAWLVKGNAGFYRLNFDLHRAPGLWLWALLFVFAWSSVMMDMRRPVYEWVMGALFDFSSRLDEIDNSARPDGLPPKLDWLQAEAKARRHLEDLGAKRGFAVTAPISMSYERAHNAYSYEARTSYDIVDQGRWAGGAFVSFDGDTGALLKFTPPHDERLGNTIENWLYALHMGLVLGMPYRLLVCVLGLVIVLLSVTGVYIWWKKRAARLRSSERLHASKTLRDHPEPLRLDF
ncbi:MAG TPA: PepSY-associated TM helix domain-containing protein [Methylocystis sp.]|nr:PepSY-associated TM helix domain-containing protein [Methylocystis sp.]